MHDFSTVPNGETALPLSASAERYVRPVNALSSQPADVWQRWELAPEVELHIKVDVANQQRALIDRLLRAARIVVGQRRT